MDCDWLNYVAIVNSSTMNIWVQTSLWHTDLKPVEWVLRSEVTGTGATQGSHQMGRERSLFVKGYAQLMQLHPAIWVSHVEMPVPVLIAPLLIQHPLMHLGKQYKMFHVLRSLLPCEGMWMYFLASAYVGNETADGKAHFLSLASSLSLWVWYK